MVMVGTPAAGSLLAAAGTETLIPFAEEGITPLLLLLLLLKVLESTLLYDMRPQVGTWKSRGRKKPVLG